MPLAARFLTLIAALALTGCGFSSSSQVSIVNPVEGASQLLVDGEPLTLFGARTDSRLSLLKKAGGNTVLVPSDRSWRDSSLQSLLKEAETLGLLVAMPLPIDLEALNSKDEVQAKKAIQRSLERIRKFTGYSNIVLWVVTPKELSEPPSSLPKRLGQVAEAVRDLDPDRPVSFDLAPLRAESLQSFVPGLQSFDALGIEVQEAGAGGQRLRLAGWQKAYFLSAYGMPDWQSSLDGDGMILEPSSQEQAAMLAGIHAQEFTPDSRCLGGFVSGWSTEPRGTLTYGAIFLQGNQTLAAFDVLQELWTESATNHPAPAIGELLIQSGDPLSPGSSIQAELQGVPSNQSLGYQWIITTQPRVERPDEAIEVISQTDGRSPTQLVGLPYASGQYRLHVIVVDEHNRAATASSSLRIAGRRPVTP